MSSRKHPQKQTTPRKTLVVTWGRSPRRFDPSLFESTTDVEDLSLFFSPITPIANSIVVQEENEKNSKTSLFSKWTSSSVQQSIGTSSQTTSENEPTKSVTGDDLMKALDRLVFTIDPVEEEQKNNSLSTKLSCAKMLHLSQEENNSQQQDYIPNENENKTLLDSNTNPNIESSSQNCLVEVSDSDRFLDAACSVAENDILAEKSLGQISKRSASWTPTGSLFSRFKVIRIENISEQGEQILRIRVLHRKKQREYNVDLSGRWLDSPVCVNDTINIVWTEDQANPHRLDESSTFVINDTKNFLILRPDVMVCPTRVSDANSCLRRTVLSERLAGQIPSKETIVGSLKHSLFEKALRENRFDEEFLRFIIPSLFTNSKIVEDLFRIGMSEEDAIFQVEKFVKPICNWANNFVGPNAAGKLMEFGIGTQYVTRILKVISTEEAIWSPLWGIKGILDVTAIIGIRKVDESFEEKILVPIELKTGKSVGPERAEHRAQIMLYSLLLADRYKQSVVPRKESGLLVRAIDDNDTLIVKGIPNSHHEFRELIMIRNKIAVTTTTSIVSSDVFEEYDIREKLPPVTQNISGECSRCFQMDTCTLFHIAVEGGERSLMNLSQQEHDKAIGKLSSEHLSYYSRWQKIIECEGRYNTNFQKQLWTRTAKERENMRRCISGLSCRKLDAIHLEFTISTKISVNELQLEVGNLVIIGVENSHHVVTQGQLISINAEKLIVLSPNFPTYIHSEVLHSQNWCVDKMDILWGNRFLQGTLASIFVQREARIYRQTQETSSQRPDSQENETHRDKIRSIFIDLKFPRFWDSGEIGKRYIRDCSTALLQELLNRCDSMESIRRGLAQKKCNIIGGEKRSNLNLASLTSDQIKAVTTTLAAQDNVCILGSPGSGKTTTVAFIVQMLCELGKSVLVCSFTHAACDNLLMKIKSRGVPVLRLGLAGNIRKELQTSTLSDSCTVADLEKHLNNPRLVCGSTCLGVKHALIQRKMFDYCIIDEAGQLSEPIALGPLFRAKCAIFVGDSKQLPPLVISPEAKSLGMDKSIFERLVERFPSITVPLTTQFRMNLSINTLVNELFYSGTLKCGNAAVENRKLNVPKFHRVFMQQQPKTWLYHCCDPERSVVFLNTDGLSNGMARESRRQTNKFQVKGEDDNDEEEESIIVNMVEAQIIHLIVDRLARAGTHLCDIGVISPYRSQLKVLRSRLVEAVEVDTVDKYQGRDKECILVSLVRSNPACSIGSLLSDWRRLNVAFSRAKCKLVVVGSATTLSSSPVCLQFLNCVRSKNWIVNMEDHDNLLLKNA